LLLLSWVLVLLLVLLLLVLSLQEAVRMDHLEVVRMMEQSGGKVWEEGKVRHTR
jgi:hypothetical protein